MTVEALSPQDSQDAPFEGVEGEQPHDLLAEAKALLLAAHDLYAKAQKRGLPHADKRAYEKDAGLLRMNADTLIAKHLGLNVDNPDYHRNLRVLGNRRDLREEALQQRRMAARAARNIGKKAFTSAKREQQDAFLDNQSRAAGEAVIHPWEED